MIPLYADPGWTFRFAETRLVPAFYLPGAAVGLTVNVHDNGVVVRSAVVEDGERVALDPPFVAHAGTVLVVLPAYNEGNRADTATEGPPHDRAAHDAGEPQP